MKPSGHKFRRQHPVSIYVADFYCHSLKLIIEVDGDIRSHKEVFEHDAQRQRNLENEGLHFLRFTNKEVEKNLKAVTRKIESSIEKLQPLTEEYSIHPGDTRKTVLSKLFLRRELQQSPIEGSPLGVWESAVCNSGCFDHLFFISPNNSNL